MRQEQQQRIMGYFIEEAKDHLNTIEQGLLNLQSTMEDPEMLNELFRAAHSVKGGAAMLGINSIQRTAHRLEDSFKLLQASPIKTDYQLESLFLQVFDKLENLVEQLQTPTGLTDEIAGNILSNAESIFEQLHNHLENLSHRQAGKTTSTSPHLAQSGETNSRQLPATFKRDVLVELRAMLQLFKQSDTQEHRGTLQNHCQRLFRMGEEWALSGWGELIETARIAIANTDNSYRHLANLTIKEIKQAQELAITGRSFEITPSTELKSLIPRRSKDANIAKDYSYKNSNIRSNFPQNLILSGSERPYHNISSITPLSSNRDTYIPKEETYIQPEITYIQPDNSADRDRGKQGSNSLNSSPQESSGYPSSNRQLPDHVEPEMGMAEINTLADIFEGQTPDLDETWEEEEIINLDENHLGLTVENSLSQNDRNDLADLIGDVGSTEVYQTEGATSDDFGYWLGDEYPKNGTKSPKRDRHPESNLALDDEFSDLLFDPDSPDTITTPSISTEDFDSLFDSNFLAEDSTSAGTITDWETNSWNINTSGDSSPSIPANPSQEEASQRQWEFKELREPSNSSGKGESASPEVNREDIEFLNFEVDMSKGLPEDLFDDEFTDNTPAEQNYEFLFNEEVTGIPQSTNDDWESLFPEGSESLPSSPAPVQESIEDFNWDEDVFASDGVDTAIQLPATDEAETGLFDWGETPKVTQSATDDLASLFDEAREDFTESPAQSSTDNFSWDEDLFANEGSNSEIQLPEAETGLFDWGETEEVIQSATDDLASLLAQTREDFTESPAPVQESIEDFNWDEDVFASDGVDTAIQLPATDEAETGLFDWGETPKVTQSATDDLASLFDEAREDFTESPAQSSTDNFSWDEDLFANEGSNSEIQLPEAETGLFDWGETPEITQSATDDFASLFDEATPPLDEFPTLAQTSGEDFNWDEDLFISTPSEAEREIEGEREWFEENENTEKQPVVNQELELLFGEETEEVSQAPSVAASPSNELMWDEDSFISVEKESGINLESPRDKETEIELFDGNDNPENQTEVNGDGDLDSLFGEVAEASIESPSLGELSAIGEFNWDEDLLNEGNSDSEIDLITEKGEEIGSGRFDWEEKSITDRAELENLELLLGDNPALFQEVQPLSGGDIGELRWEEEVVDSSVHKLEKRSEINKNGINRVDDGDNLPDLIQANTQDMAGFGDLFTSEDQNNLWWETSRGAEGELPSQANTGFDELEELLNGNSITNISSSYELDELDALLDGHGILKSSRSIHELDELDALLDEPDNLSISTSVTELDELDILLNAEINIDRLLPELKTTDSGEAREGILNEITPKPTNKTKETEGKKAKTTNPEDILDAELEKMLRDAQESMGGPPANRLDQRQNRPQPRRIKMFEQNMRVSAKHLDNLSNLVGELVVSRNSLEQDQERLRQFLDNLQHQVLGLSDVGSRMRDLYERSLLEGSLLASHHSYRTSFSSDERSQNHQNQNNSAEYHPLEMDRFTGFHLLSQEMIELIVQVRESASDIEFLVEETDQVTRNLRQVTTQLQEGLTRSRMVPFAENADRLHRAVRDISMKLGKEAQLSVDGRETLIDKMILEHLYAPMTHLVNNALTHGIETPDVRKAGKKPPVGQIVLNAFHQGNQTVISISDDGAGIDPEKIRKKAIQLGLVTPAQAKTLTALELYDFLFHPGFTTKEQADDYAGRGVGMDVVRTSLSEIRGDIYTDSTLGKGTTFTIRLPLTLSICKALSCLSDRARIAFPIDGVEDMFDVPSDRIQTNEQGKPCIQWRDTLIAFQPLSELLAYNRQLSRGNVYGGKREDDLISIVVLRSPGNFLAIQVDQVLGEQEIVIKQLEGPAPKPVGIAGATVLGDGKIMPIADVLELIDLSLGRLRKDSAMIWLRDQPELPGEEDTLTAHEPMVLIVDDSITVRELLSMTFSKAGYRVEQARDGQEAWEKLRSGLPCDIVFCDIEMPRMDGLELLSRLQKDDILNQIPIAMLTSRGAKRHRQMASQLGASGYFTKPYLEEALLDAAQRMIKGEVLLNPTED